jgi:hypothetical protein
LQPGTTIFLKAEGLLNKLEPVIVVLIQFMDKIKKVIIKSKIY